MALSRRSIFLLSSSASLLLRPGGTAMSQTATPPPAAGSTTELPTVTVEAPKQIVRAPRQKPKPGEVARRTLSPSAAPPASVSPAAQLTARGVAFDQARGNIFTTIGTTSSTISHNTIEDL